MADVLAKRYLNYDVELQERQKVAELLHVRQLVSQGLQVLVTLSAYFPEVQLLSHFLSELSKNIMLVIVVDV